MLTRWKEIVPVLPSSDIARDTTWYSENVGFEVVAKDTMYAVLKRESLYVHLQWHVGTKEDPLLGGSVIRIFVEGIQPIFEELVAKGTVPENNLRMGTAWNTNEFGFYDLNKNAIFIVEDVHNKP